jgi:hypothetical protein
MNDKFDELAKGMAQSVTRRTALRKFGAGLTGIALAWLGMPHRARAQNSRPHCNCSKPPTYECERWYAPGTQAYYDCVFNCPAICAKKGGPY